MCGKKTRVEKAAEAKQSVMDHSWENIKEESGVLFECCYIHTLLD